MFERLKKLGAKFMRRLRPLLGPPGPIEDPEVGVREPRKFRPGGRNSAVALLEPEPEQIVRAVGKGHGL